MTRLLGLAICALALFLPHRLRLLLCETLGWMLQLAHLAVYRLARFILRQLEK